MKQIDTKDLKVDDYYLYYNPRKKWLGIFKHHWRPWGNERGYMLFGILQLKYRGDFGRKDSIVHYYDLFIDNAQKSAMVYKLTEEEVLLHVMSPEI